MSKNAVGLMVLVVVLVACNRSGCGTPAPPAPAPVMGAVPVPVQPPPPPQFHHHSAWVTSSDGTISLRMSTDKEQYAPGEPINIRLQIRNDSDRAVRVTTVHLGAYGNALTITGPGKPEYQGPWKEMAPPAPTQLTPGQVVSTSDALTADNWKGLEVVGIYTVTLKYHSEPTEQHPKLWSGDVKISGTFTRTP